MTSKEDHRPHIRDKDLAKIKWKSDFDKGVIVENFVSRKWSEADEDEDENWNFYWATVQSVRNIFRPQSGFRLAEN